MLKNKIYIGGGLTSDQLLWVIPILHSYNKEKITKLVFENFTTKKISRSDLVKNILKKYTIFDHSSFLPFLLKNKYLRYIYVLISYFPAILFFSVYVNRYNILDKNRSWFKSQIIHSIWDTSLLMCDDKKIKPNLYSYFKNIDILNIKRFFI